MFRHLFVHTELSWAQADPCILTDGETNTLLNSHYISFLSQYWYNYDSVMIITVVYIYCTPIINDGIDIKKRNQEKKIPCSVTAKSTNYVFIHHIMVTIFLCVISIIQLVSLLNYCRSPRQVSSVSPDFSSLYLHWSNTTSRREVLTLVNQSGEEIYLDYLHDSIKHLHLTLAC